jgi:hypothetical protein
MICKSLFDDFSIVLTRVCELMEIPRQIVQAGIWGPDSLSLSWSQSFRMMAVGDLGGKRATGGVSSHNKVIS